MAFSILNPRFIILLLSSVASIAGVVILDNDLTSSAPVILLIAASICQALANCSLCLSDLLDYFDRDIDSGVRIFSATSTLVNTSTLIPMYFYGGLDDEDLMGGYILFSVTVLSWLVVLLLPKDGLELPAKVAAMDTRKISGIVICILMLIGSILSLSLTPKIDGNEVNVGGYMWVLGGLWLAIALVYFFAVLQLHNSHALLVLVLFIPGLVYTFLELHFSRFSSLNLTNFESVFGSDATTQFEAAIFLSSAAGLLLVVHSFFFASGDFVLPAAGGINRIRALLSFAGLPIAIVGAITLRDGADFFSGVQSNFFFATYLPSGSCAPLLSVAVALSTLCVAASHFFSKGKHMLLWTFAAGIMFIAAPIAFASADGSREVDDDDMAAGYALLLLAFLVSFLANAQIENTVKNVKSQGLLVFLIGLAFAVICGIGVSIYWNEINEAQDNAPSLPVADAHSELIISGKFALIIAAFVGITTFQPNSNVGAIGALYFITVGFNIALTINHIASKDDDIPNILRINTTDYKAAFRIMIIGLIGMGLRMCFSFHHQPSLYNSGDDADSNDTRESNRADGDSAV